jgi:hypothetical protein
MFEKLFKSVFGVTVDIHWGKCEERDWLGNTELNGPKIQNAKELI